MAEQRDQVTNHGTESIADVQRRMDRKRQDISHNIGEMKKSMNHEVDRVKGQIHSTFDVKTQMYRYPMALAIGALALGFFAGRGIGSRAGRSDYDYDMDFPGGIRSSEDMSEHFDFQDADIRQGRQHHKPMISPQVRERVSTRVEGALSEVADTFLSELVRVGRDVLVPRLMGALSGTIETKISAHRPNYVSTGEHESYVGGNMGPTGRTGNF